MPVYDDKKAKDGTKRYYFEVSYKNEKGKYSKIKKRGFTSSTLAKQAMRDVESALNKGNYIKPVKLTYREFMEKWMGIKQTNVKKNTYGTYKGLIDRHILPEIGHVEVAKLNAMLIEEFYAKLIRAGKLSDGNVQKIHTIIKDSLNKAVVWDLILKNPAAQVERPKVSKKEIKVWENPEIDIFLEAAKVYRYRTAFLLALTTGMRQGEILGLRWKDIDFKKSTLSIVQTLSHDGKELSIGAKTTAGNRVIAIDRNTLSELSKHRAKQKEEMMANRNVYTDLDLVFCRTLGTQLPPRDLSKCFERAMFKAKVKKIRFHDMRHTHATLLLLQNVNPKIVSERLGHANVRITLDTYSHLLPNMQADTAEAFGKIFYGVLDDTNDNKDSGANIGAKL